jgi:signal transduction histidine kinase
MDRAQQDGRRLASRRRRLHVATESVFRLILSEVWSALRLSWISVADDALGRGRSYLPEVRAIRVRRISRSDLGDLTLAAVLTAVAELDVWVRGTVPGPRWENALLLPLVALPLAWRRRWPCAALAIIAAAIAAQALLVAGHPPSGLLYAGPILIGAYSVGAHAPWSRRAFAALAALAVAYDIIYLNAQGGLSGSFNAVAGALVWLLLPTGAWLLGWYMRRRRREAAAAAEAVRVEREREQQRLAALEQERGRMARELHDILAHSVSLMGVQAGAAEEVLTSDPERARPVLRSIQQTSRDSVAELRRLLGMLRAEELEPERAPQPSLDQLDALVTRMSEAGLPVELQVEGARHPLPAGIELTAYRVVQESLTNALKHAHPSRVEVVIRYQPAQLDVRIHNDGVSPLANGNGSGHGLLGMNERVSLYGGHLDTGLTAEGTFRVHAEIPFETAPA